jgi:hypothetical protein
MKALYYIFLAVLLCSFSSETKALELNGRFKQGSLIFGKLDKPGHLLYEGQTIKTDSNGNFIFGFGRDHPLETYLEIVYSDNEIERIPIVLEKRHYSLQHIKGLPESMVNPPQGVLDRIYKERMMVKHARSHDTLHAYFLSEFEWPVLGRISGVYGSQRVLNGIPKQPHFGIDIAAPEGEVVKAPSAGIVRLAESDLYYTGGTVILDHGYGLSSTLMHLSSVDVVVGQAVNKGEEIGKVGSTGRSTGPHLDWRMNWFEHRIDPQMLPLPPVSEQ